MIRYSRSINSFFIIVLLAFVALACKEDDVKINDGSDQAINNWVYDVMKEVYYWTDEIPANVNKNQDPTDFFESLIYEPEDDFSIIVPDYQALVDALSGVTKEAGYEFSFFYIENGSDALVAIVSYVKRNSPASNAGLKRGDVIDKINDKLITRTNYVALYQELSSNHTLSFSRYNEEASQYEPEPPISLEVIELQENPNYLDTVYVVDGNKIGYYVYNFFAAGLTDNDEYDKQMDDIFASFKSEGITHLILDLRYNSGGSISSALNLASLIGEDSDSDKVFYENRWNEFYNDYWESQGNDQKGRFIDKAENIGDNLSGSKLYVLTGSNTASASELIINGLAPYMEVFLIGDKTVGKNVGSIAIEDEENGLNNYGLLPIAFQVYNSLGQSDYGDGFQPNIAVEDYAVPMKPLGDINETLLGEAIKLITGSDANPGRTNGRFITRSEVMSSIDKKVRTNIMMGKESRF